MPPNIPPESWTDTLTRIDELLISQIDQNKSIIDQNESIKSTLLSILNAHDATPPEPTPPEPQLIITYPEAGDTKELAAGTARFDFYNGKVTLPTGTSEDLSDALSEHDLTHCHSIAINAELPVTVRIEDFGAFTTNAGIPFILPNIEFKRISIITTRKTNISIFASTSPKVIYFEPESFYSGNPFTYRGTVTTAGTPDEIDIRSTLGRNAHNGWIANMGTTAGVLHLYIYDGTSWTTTYYTIGVDAVENLEMADIASLKVDSDVDATTFEINLR